MLPCVQPIWKLNSGAFGTPDFRDPVQGGILKNCSLIAVLASLALKQKISVQSSVPYKFTFYDKSTLVSTPIFTDNNLPMDSGNNLMHAKSDAPNKIWPSLYEKAYYQYLDNLPAPTGLPDYCKYTGWQSPVTVLKQLTGKNPPPQQNCLNANPDTVFSHIDSLCDNYGRSTTNRIIRYPAVAWTNDTGSQYSDTTIALQHTYSLLGVTGTGAPPAWTSKYVVLRNPYGKGKGDPVMPGYLFTGAWYNINLGENDGVFALRADQFVKYFTGYAWVV